MIANQKQFKITSDRLAALQDDLRKFDEIGLVREGVDPIIIAAQRRSLESEKARLEGFVERYNALREGRIESLRFDDINGLGGAFIEARLALGLTQRELAQRLNLREQQIQRYEQERYQSASLARLQQVAQALDAEPSIELRLPDRSGVTIASAFDANLLPIREMKKRGWLRDIRLPGEMPRSDLALAEYFVRSNSAGGSVVALMRQRVRLGGRVDPYAISAWKARILQLARKRVDSSQQVQPLDSAFIKQLVHLSAKSDGPMLAIEALRERGVLVVMERHMPGTHLDGAAMLMDNTVPVIGLTLRHDRLDNFWFVLLHEVAHIVCHWDRGLSEGFFDDERAPTRDKIEAEADEFALNALIPEEVWKSAFVRFTKDRDQIISYAGKLDINPAIVAGRIRHERKDYTLFGELVGNRTVRGQFSEFGT